MELGAENTRDITGRKKQTRDGRQQHNEKNHDLYSSPNIPVMK
jgi:hypothetical protein